MLAKPESWARLLLDVPYLRGLRNCWHRDISFSARDTPAGEAVRGETERASFRHRGRNRRSPSAIAVRWTFRPLRITSRLMVSSQNSRRVSRFGTPWAVTTTSLARQKTSSHRPALHPLEATWRIIPVVTMRGARKSGTRCWKKVGGREGAPLPLKGLSSYLIRDLCESCRASCLPKDSRDVATGRYLSELYACGSFDNTPPQ